MGTASRMTRAGTDAARVELVGSERAVDNAEPVADSNASGGGGGAGQTSGEGCWDDAADPEGCWANSLGYGVESVGHADDPGGGRRAFIADGAQAAAVVVAATAAAGVAAACRPPDGFDAAGSAGEAAVEGVEQGADTSTGDKTGKGSELSLAVGEAAASTNCRAEGGSSAAAPLSSSAVAASVDRSGARSRRVPSEDLAPGCSAPAAPTGVPTPSTLPGRRSPRLPGPLASNWLSGGSTVDPAGASRGRGPRGGSGSPSRPPTRGAAENWLSG